VTLPPNASACCTAVIYTVLNERELRFARGSLLPIGGDSNDAT
jgi:hypothetical protein